MSASNSTKDPTKNFPAVLVKNIRACAALVCYDLLLKQNSMKLDDQHRFCFNTFHGNEEKNISSQIKLVLDGHGRYSELYDKEAPPTITDRNTQNASGNDDCNILVLKARFNEGNRFVAGTNFNIATLSAPTKKRITELISGRNIYDLAMTALRNIKKALALAGEWLNDGDLPSGQSWDDLYLHLFEKGCEISKEKSGYTGWIGLCLLTQYNEEGNDAIDLFCVDGRGGDDEGSRQDFRKKQKLEHDHERDSCYSIDTMPPSYMYSARGHTIHDRLNMIELAKLEDAQKFEDMKFLLAHRNTRNKMLLEERMQAISLAKVICPKYDADNEYWKAVHNLTLQIKTVKK